MPRPDPLVLAAAAALAAFLFVVVLFQAFSAWREWRLRRDALRTLQADPTPETADSPRQEVLRRDAEVEEGLFPLLARRIPRLWDLHHLLGQSGVRWSLRGFTARTTLAALLPGLVGLLLAGNGAVAGVAMAAGGVVPWLYLRWRKKRRLLQLESQLPDAIDLIARAVRAGHPLTEGLRMTSQEASEPLASEFRITFEEQRFGLPFEEALMGLGDRVEIVDVRILVTAILVQREVGGNLSEILEQIAETMRARFNLKRQVRVYTAQGRMSGYTLAALPIIVGSLITLINPSYIQTLFTEPLGKALLTGAFVLQFVGFLWIRRIVDVRY